MVFQDPYSSLNPRLTIRQVLKELLRFHRVVNGSEIEREMRRLLDSVGLDECDLNFYPHHFSGGQRQRIAIARALAVRPDVLIADEPVSALDVSIQATVLQVLKSLRSQLDLSVLFIAHNLAVVQHLADRIAVMYLGRIVEVAPTSDLFSHPAHPYTRALIESAPRMTLTGRSQAPALRGEPPSPVNLPSGCRFHPRCGFAQQECLSTDPMLEAYGREHEVACIFAGRLEPRAIE
jgi:oligopeptide/dipeptide ABC transporter ATP-binding protein